MKAKSFPQKQSQVFVNPVKSKEKCGSLKLSHSIIQENMQEMGKTCVWICILYIKHAFILKLLNGFITYTVFTNW